MRAQQFAARDVSSSAREWPGALFIAVPAHHLVMCVDFTFILYRFSVAAYRRPAHSPQLRPYFRRPFRRMSPPIFRDCRMRRDDGGRLPHKPDAARQGSPQS